MSRRPSSRKPEEEPSPFGAALRRSEVVVVAVIAGGILLIVGIVLLLRGGDERAPTSPGASAAALQASHGVVFSPVTADDQAIQTLARRSIEVLPAGQWPELYDAFTPEYQQRCPRDQFVKVGEDAATQLGSNLPLLRFVRLEGVVYNSASATGTIVGRVEGGSEYSVAGTFQQVAGAWKLAPVAGTQGCEAFTHISG